MGLVVKYWGAQKQKHKKQPFSDASASHLSLVLWLISSRSLNQPHHITNAALPSEVGGIAKRIKTARLRRKTKPGRDTSRPPIIAITN